MAIIPQLSLFTWKEIDELGDLDRCRQSYKNPFRLFSRKGEVN
jgi:hypothetical protein